MKTLFNLLILFILSAATLSAQQPINSKADAADNNYDIQDPVLIKTRDGASISAIIVRKKGNTEPLPAILFYTAYDQGAGDSIFGKRAVDKGYVGIVAYSRGIRTNLNNYTPYEHDGNDAYDVIDWISEQSWSNGKVGMYGGSYTGFIQWATAKNIHPALKTIVPQVAIMPGYDTPMENNVLLSFVSLGWSNDILKNKPLPQDLYDKWFEKGIDDSAFPAGMEVDYVRVYQPK